MIKSLRRLILVVGTLTFGALIWFFAQVFGWGGAHGTATIDVRSGDSMSSIAQSLQSHGVITSALTFDLDTLILGSINVQPGYYVLDKGAPFSALRSVLVSGPNVRSIDVVPGLSLREVRADLASDFSTSFANEFAQQLSILVSTSSFISHHSNPEGLIGLGMYILPPNETPTSLAHTMYGRFLSEARTIGLSPSTSSHGLDAYRILTAASIVQKEGYYFSNMPRVARVILNRLARGGGLQMDATVLYALGQDGGTVTPADLRINSPYNTYLYPGLTPTPICTPSIAAIKAVLHPATGPWLYFMLMNHDGKMAFSSTYAQQLANEAIAAKAGI